MLYIPYFKPIQMCPIVKLVTGYLKTIQRLTIQVVHMLYIYRILNQYLQRHVMNKIYA